ncbi:MAG: hypothetical protein KGM99_15025 [Burkholderiales bacterium]|nr:hypothetical protein [Burkholderiales bacterium]
MNYTFVAHLPLIVENLRIANKNGSPYKLYALIDQTQIPGLKAMIWSEFTTAPKLLLFEACFAEAAIELSPILLEVPGDIKELEILDKLCQSLPIIDAKSALQLLCTPTSMVGGRPRGTDLQPRRRASGSGGM